MGPSFGDGSWTNRVEHRFDAVFKGLFKDRRHEISGLEIPSFDALRFVFEQRHGTVQLPTYFLKKRKQQAVFSK